MRNIQNAWIFTYYDNNDLSAILNQIQPGDTIIAVDAGLDLLLKYHIMPQMVIGDFDSMSQQSIDILSAYQETLPELKETNDIYTQDFFQSIDNTDQKPLNEQLNFIRLKPEKDETDTELAVEWCLNNHFKTIYIINSMQNRFDHCTGIISILEYALDQNIHIHVISATQEIYFANTVQPLNYPQGSTFSLCPVSDKVTKVKTLNCSYPLNEETLYRNKTRGISNLIGEENAQITFESGKLLVIVQLQNEENSLSETSTFLSEQQTFNNNINTFCSENSKNMYNIEY
jgi:thiamine pyrophosphokinase